MSFVTREDLESNIRLYRLDQIIDEDDNIIVTASAEAVAMINDALIAKYDTVSIFSQTGTNRAVNVLAWAKYITLYKLYERVPDSQVPERVIKNYDDTYEMLQKIANDKTSVALPRLKDEKGETRTKTRWGSVTKRSN